MAKKILFINQEIVPYVPDSDLALMGKQVPMVIQDKGHEIRTFMPKWGTINERRGQLHEVIRLSGMNIIIDETDHPLIIKVATIAQTRIQVYFIDNEDYFSKRRNAAVADDDTDNGERAIFFARGVLETVKKLRWVPDIIHVQGWMGAVVPLYIKTAYSEEPSFADTKVVTSLFTDSISLPFGANFKKFVEFRSAKASMLDKYSNDFDFQDLGKLAIDYSDGIIVANQSANKTLREYASASGKPVLDFPGEEFGDAYESFYDSL